MKRPLSAYMLYNNYRRPVLRKEHPGMIILIKHLELTLPDVSKVIGEEWNKLTME